VSLVAVMSEERGVVYVAAHSLGCVVEAAASASSLRRFHPTLPVTLFTDPTTDFQIPPGLFTSVVQRKWCHEAEGCEGGRVCKIGAIAASPYQRTLYLDTDTRVWRPIESIFDELDHCDLALTEAMGSSSRSVLDWQRRMFAGGVMCLRRVDPVLRLLADWQRTVRLHLDLLAGPPGSEPAYFSHVPDPVVRRRLLRFDQVALAQHLSPDVNTHGLRVKVLDHSWNHRGPWAGVGEPPHIHHSNRWKVSEEQLEVALRPSHP